MSSASSDASSPWFCWKEGRKKEKRKKTKVGRGFFSIARACLPWPLKETNTVHGCHVLASAIVMAD
jgi:hypothetical protein